MKKFYLLITFLFMFIITGVISQSIKGKVVTKDDLFDDFISTTNATVCESGFRVCIPAKFFDIKECNNFLNELGIYKESYKNILQNEKIVCIEFEKETLSGYIEDMKGEGENTLILNISDKSNKNNLQYLQSKVEKASGKKSGELNYYNFVKASIPNQDIGNTNKKLIKLLQNKKASDIETVNLDNGFSTVAYTRRYEVLRNNGKLMDFNFAVCSYSLGNYLYIGTPEIITSY